MLTETDELSRLESKFVVGTNAFVDNMINAVAAFLKNLQNSFDEIFDVRRAGPDVHDGADALSGSKIFVRRAQETIFAAAINPRSTDDITPRTCVDHGLLARDLGFSVPIDRPGLVFDRIRGSADGFTVESILRAKVNEFGARPRGRFSQGSRPLDVHGVSFGRILLGLIDLDHCAVDDQGGLSIPDATANGFSVGNIEIGMSQRHYLVLTSEPLRSMTTNEPGGACNQNLHRFRM